MECEMGWGEGEALIGWANGLLKLHIEVMITTATSILAP